MNDAINRIIIYAIVYPKNLMNKCCDKLSKIQLQRYWKVTVRNMIDNPKILSRGQVKEINEFFKPYCKINTSTHAYLFEKTGRFAPNYIPNYLHFTVIDPYFNDWKWAGQNSNKCFQRKLFGLNRDEMPITIAYRCNGMYFDSDDNTTSLDDILSISPKGAVFIKPATDSCGGHGVMRIDPNDYATEVMKYLESCPGDVIIQEAIKQSPIMASLNTSSVNTVRCMSLLNRDGSVKLVSCIVRIGAPGANVDNLSSGGFCIGVDQNGRLMERGFTKTGQTCTSHPVTGVVFHDIVVPSYDLMKELVIKAHRHVPNCRLVSWDVAFDIDNRPLIVEGNLCSGGINLHQLSTGPVFGDDTVAILDEVFGHLK